MANYSPGWKERRYTGPLQQDVEEYVDYWITFIELELPNRVVNFFYLSMEYEEETEREALEDPRSWSGHTGGSTPTEFTKVGPTFLHPNKKRDVWEREALDIWPYVCRACDRYYYDAEEIGLCSACLQEVENRLRARKYQST